MALLPVVVERLLAHRGRLADHGELGDTGAALAALAERFDVHPNQTTQWKTELLQRAADIFATAAEKREVGPVSYTPARARVDRDGKVRLILAHADPGYHNWFDAQGCAARNLTCRNLMSTESTTFHTRLLKRADLAAALPADSVRVTPHERVAQMHARFDSIRRRYGL